MAQEKCLDEQCKDIENFYKSNPKEVHQQIREISDRIFEVTVGCIKNKFGNTLFVEQEIQQPAEHIKELYDAHRNVRMIKFNNTITR